RPPRFSSLFETASNGIERRRSLQGDVELLLAALDLEGEARRIDVLVLGRNGNILAGWGDGLTVDDHGPGNGVRRPGFAAVQRGKSFNGDLERPHGNVGDRESSVIGNVGGLGRLG